MDDDNYFTNDVGETISKNTLKKKDLLKYLDAKNVIKNSENSRSNISPLLEWWLKQKGNENV